MNELLPDQSYCLSFDETFFLIKTVVVSSSGNGKSLNQASDYRIKDIL